MVEFKRPKLELFGHFISLIFLFGIFISDAYSYILTESTQRVPIRWGTSALEINVDTFANDNDPSKNIFCRGLNPSLQATCTHYALPEINETLAYWNQSSPVRITSNPFSTNRLSFSSDPRFFSPGVVAITLLSYNPGDGIIRNGQIYVNHLTSPGFCFTRSKSAMGCVYLGDVIAHEFGHFAGLAHSEVRESTMLYTSFRGQHSLHPDDVSGLRSIYAGNSYGRIKGRVLGGSRVPVFGAHVQAISSQRGDIVGAAVSQEDGSFVINGLDLNETYYLYTEPLRKLDSLPDAFRSVQTNFCPGNYVGSFFESCSSQSRGQPLPLRLTESQKELEVGAVSIRCHVRVNPSYLDSKLRDGQGVYEFRSQASKPLTSFVGFYPASEQLRFDDPTESMSDILRLDLSTLGDLPAGAELRMKLLSTAIGSPIDFMINVSGPFGDQLDPDRQQMNPTPGRNYPPPNEEPFTLKPLFQRSLSYPLSSDGSQNVFEISLAPRLLDSYELMMSLPSNALFTLKDRPYLVMFEIVRGNEILFSDQTTNLSDNMACLDAPFTFPVKANNVSSAAIAGESEERGDSQVTSASCGTIEPPQSGGGEGILSFFVGLALLALLPKKIRKNS